MHKIITSILEIFGHLEEFGCVRVCFFSENCHLKKKRVSLSVKIATKCSHVSMEQDGVEEQHLWLGKTSLVLKSSPASVFQFPLDCDSGYAFVSSSTHLSTH